MLARTFRFLLPTFVVLVGFVIVLSLFAQPLGSAGSSSGELRGPSGLSLDELKSIDLKGVVLPREDLSPEAVVRLQLAGLADPRGDGVGILQCYCFASPANRTMTGPLDRFGRMVRQGPYASMAHPMALLVGRAQIDGGLARLLVTVIDEGARIQAFTFVLARQEDPPFENCWMTEAVLPAQPVGTAPEDSSPDDSA